PCRESESVERLPPRGRLDARHPKKGVLRQTLHRQPTQPGEHRQRTKSWLIQTMRGLRQLPNTEGKSRQPNCRRGESESRSDSPISSFESWIQIQEGFEELEWRPARRRRGMCKRKSMHLERHALPY